MQILDIVDKLSQTRTNSKAAFVRHIPEKDVKIRDSILIVRLKITIAHRQFIKIAEHGHIQLFFCIHLSAPQMS